MNKQHLTIIFLFIVFQAFSQNKSRDEICNKTIVPSSVKVGNKFYLYKIIFQRKNAAEVILPEFNRKSDSVILNKVMSKICKLHKLRYLIVAQNCAVIKMHYSPFKPTHAQNKMMEEKFIGVFDLVTNKKVKHP